MVQIFFMIVSYY